MKKYAYHILKDNFKGDSLYPLNELKIIYSDIYAEEIKKYNGREKLMDVKNPILNCLWNDVVQFSCLDARLTLDAIKVFNPSLIGRKFKIFTLDLEKVDPKNCCLFTPRETKVLHELEDDQYETFNLDKFTNLSEVPEIQIERWKECLQKNLPLFFWSRTTHFMHKGKMPLSDGEIFQYEVR